MSNSAKSSRKKMEFHHFRLARHLLPCLLGSDIHPESSSDTKSLHTSTYCWWKKSCTTWHIKPCKYWDIDHKNWCRISSINSMKRINFHKQVVKSSEYVLRGMLDYFLETLTSSLYMSNFCCLSFSPLNFLLVLFVHLCVLIVHPPNKIRMGWLN